MRGRLRRRSTRRSEAWRPVTSGCESRRGRYGTQSARSCDRAGGQVAAWIRWTLPELKRGPAAGNRHGGAPRGAIPVATGSPRACHAVSRLASVIERPSVRLAALRRPPRSGVGKRTRDDPRAQRRAETRGDGMMEETEDDVTKKRVRIGRMANGHRGGTHRSTTVILRCERQRASKDERPPNSWPHTGRRPSRPSLRSGTSG